MENTLTFVGDQLSSETYVSESGLEPKTTTILGDQSRPEFGLKRLTDARDAILMSAKDMYRPETSDAFWELRENALKAITKYIIYLFESENEQA